MLSIVPFFVANSHFAVTVIIIVLVVSKLLEKLTCQGY